MAEVSLFERTSESRRQTTAELISGSQRKPHRGEGREPSTFPPSHNLPSHSRLPRKFCPNPRPISRPDVSARIRPYPPLSAYGSGQLCILSSSRPDPMFRHVPTTVYGRSSTPSPAHIAPKTSYEDTGSPSPSVTSSAQPNPCLTNRTVSPARRATPSTP